MNILKKALTFSVVLTTIVWTMGAAALVPVASAVTLQAGDLIKASGPAVYYYAADGMRYTFPTQSTYMTWYNGFGSVKTITDNELAAIDLAGNVTARPGTNLVKITTVPKTYAVGPDGLLYHIASESAAVTLYGANWAKKVIDISDGFWTNYTDTGIALTGTSYPEGQLVKKANSSDVYRVNMDGSWSKFASESAFTLNNFRWDDIVTAPSTMTVTAGANITGAVDTYRDVSQGGGAGAVVGSGNLSVSMTTVAAATVIADSTSGDGTEYLSPVMKLKFTANGGAVEVDSFRLKRGGISSNSDINTLYLYDGDTLISDSPSYSSNYYTFGTNFVVSSGSTRNLTLMLDLANGTAANKSFDFTLEASSDVTLVAGSVGGSFPMASQRFETAAVSDFGKLTIAHAADPGTTIEAGLADQELWRFTLAAADQKVRVDEMVFTTIGTLESDTFENMYLYDGLTVLGEADGLTADKTVTFSNLDYNITAGQTKTLYLRGDVVTGTNRTFYFEVQNPYDVTAWDTNYERFVKINQADTFTLITATNTTTISAGSLQVTLATDSPSGNVALGQTNQLLGKWNFKAIGEDIKVSNLVVRTTAGGAMDTEDVNNGKILVNGTQLSTTKDLDSDASADGNATDDDAATDDDTTFSFGNTFIIPEGQTYVVEIYGDIVQGDGTVMAASDSIQLVLETGNANVFRMSTGTTANSTSVSASELIVAEASLTTTLNSSVSNMTVVQGAQQVLVGSWAITSGVAEGSEVTSLVLVDDGDVGIGNAFVNLSLRVDGTEIATSANPTTTNGGTVTMNFSSSPVSIGAGLSKTFDLYADATSNADAAWTSDGDEIKISSVTGRGVSTNATVTDSTGAVGQQITVATAGTLTVAAASAPTNPTSTYIVAGKTNQTVAAWEFSASNVESLVVKRINMKEAGTDDLPGNVRNLKLYVDGVQAGATVGSLINSTANTALFYDADGLFTVPKNDSVYVELRVDGTPADNSTFSTDGSDLTFRVANIVTHTASTDISAMGETSNTFAIGSAAANYDGNAHKFVKTKPTFSLESGVSSVLAPTTATEVMRFRVTADSAFKVSFLNGANNNIRFTVLATAADDDANTNEEWSLYEYGTDTLLASLTGQETDDGTNATLSMLFEDADSAIAAGSYKIYYVEGDLGDYETTGDSIRLKINNAAADMSWNDGSTTSADLSGANYAGIGLPLNGPALVK